MIIIVLVTTGGVNLTDFLSQTLQRIKQQWLNKSDIAGYDGQMVAMPAMTAKVLSATELQSKTNGFRLSLLDTGTDAYLRQDERSMHCMIPSNTIINTAGPEQLSASKSGLLSMYLKTAKEIYIRC